METDPRHRRHDPELDPPAGPAAADPGGFSRGRTRLVVNPFLAILGWILACHAMGIGLKSRNPFVSLAALSGTLASIPLLQYHCLDCGETGWAWRARRHLCPLAAARDATAGTSGTSFPTIMTQLKFWLAIVTLAGSYYLLNVAARP